MTARSEAAPQDGAEEAFQVGVVTLFPELFDTFCSTSFVGKAQAKGLVRIQTHQLRDHGLGKHLSVDDTPYGGGSGMVIRVDCVVEAIEALEEKMGGRAHRVLMTPQGQPLSADGAKRFGAHERVLFVCGRYEGFDDRIRSYVDEEMSLGDFVLTGGEIPAMAAIEASIRFRPGVLGNQHSTEEESFSPELEGGLEYPQFTRPAEYRGAGVPDVLKSGNHARVAEWRRAESQRRTSDRRPDLLLARTSKDTE